MQTVVITGAGGQLAADLQAAFAAHGDYHVVAARREDLDICDPVAVETFMREVRPAVILNPASYNKVDQAEDEPLDVYRVNALGPRLLAGLADATETLLVHFSTDYVFDGALHRPYSETDVPSPQSAYAIAKLAGEYFTLASGQHYVLRVCGLFGLAGRTSRHSNFIERMAQLAQSGRPLRVVADQIVAPTYCVDVAAATLALVQKRPPAGVYHCTAEGECSWYEYAAAIFQMLGISANMTAVTAAEYGARARRPSYSILDNARLIAAGLPRPRHWHEGLRAYCAART